MVGGIDTHADFHQAAVIDSIGRHLATEQFETTPGGYRRLLDWLRSHGDVLAVGIEGTGAYGAEIARFLTAHGITVLEVDRPDRKARRDNGKSDPIDAYAAATAVLSGRAGGTPKSRNEMSRVLKPGGRFLLLDHVPSSAWPVRAIQRLVELITVPLGGEHLLRRPLRHIQAAGLPIEERDRFRLGLVERLAARKPAR